MSVNVLVECIDSKYIEEIDTLVNFCFLSEYDTYKMFLYIRQDHTHKGQPATHDDMRYLADLYRGKKYRQIIDDDPTKTTITQEDYEKWVDHFRKEISNQMVQAVEGLDDTEQQIARRLGKLHDEGKINSVALLKAELDMKTKLDE